MLLRAEDQAKFQGRIDDKGATVWASYRIEGRVEGKPVVQSDKRMFASEQEARTWLVGEAEERGFKDFEPEVHAGGVTSGSKSLNPRSSASPTSHVRASCSDANIRLSLCTTGFPSTRPSMR